MDISKKILSTSPHPGNLAEGDGTHDSVQLLEKARADTDTVLKELGAQLDGLSEAEAASRLKQVGTNEITREKYQSALMRLLHHIMNRWSSCSWRWVSFPNLPVTCGRWRSF